MIGTLHKTGKNWSVLYSDLDGAYKLPVSPDSLSNPKLSTYWVEHREVEFKIINDLVKYAKIIEDDNISDWDVTLMDGLEEEDDWDTKPGFAQQRIEQMIHIAAKEYSTGAWNETATYNAFMAGVKFMLNQLNNKL